MKKTKGKLFLSFLFLLTPVLLTSCEEPLSSVTSGTSSPSVPTSDKDTGSGTTSSSGDVDPGEEDDPYIIDPEDSEWSDEVTQSMVQYLGGNILPYVNLGGDITVKYTKDDSKDDYRSYLTLTGGAFVSSYLNDAKKKYDDYDWTAVVYKDSGFYASRDAQNLEISVAKSSAGLFVLTAYWTEPWDDTTLTEWKDVTVTGFKNRLGAFYNIPFVYLGTTDYTTSFSATESTAVTITGGRYYDDNVMTSFFNAFQGAGWKVEINPDDGTSMIATYTAANGTVLKATLSQYQKRARIVIGIDETYDKSNNNVWTSDITNEISSLTTEKIPYLYLGTVYPRILTTESNTRKITIKGDLWDDDIFENADATFNADGWTKITKETTEGGEETDEDEYVQYTKTSNHITYTATLTKVSLEDSYYPKLAVSMAEEFDPTSISDWTSDIKSAFKAKFGDSMDDIMSFIYLGTSNPTINTTYTKDDKLVINGGTWNEEGICGSFDETLNDWAQIDKVYYGTGTNNNDSRVQKIALKTFDDVTYKVGLFTLYTGSDKTTYLEITKTTKDKYDTATSWSTETQTLIDNYFADIETTGSVIPYFYTGVSGNEITFVSSSYNTGKLKLVPTITYETFGYMVMNIYGALTNAGWDVTLNGYKEYSYASNYNECHLYNIVATKTFSEDSTLELYIYFNRITSAKKITAMSGSSAYSHIAYKETYDESNPADGWGDTLNTFIQNTYKFTLPYFYLGTKHHYYTYDENKNQLIIYGNKWSDYDADTNNEVSMSPIVMNARDTLTSEAGFVINNSTSYSTTPSSIYKTASAKVQFTCTNSDGNTVTIKVTNATTYLGGAPMITITSTDNNFYDGSVTEWSDSVKTVIDENLEDGMSLPFIYLGSDAPTTTATKISDSLTMLKMIGSKWNDSLIDTAKEQLEEDGGWTITTTSSSLSNTTSPALQAYKFYDNNTALRIIIRGASDGTGKYTGSSYAYASDAKCTMLVFVDKPDSTGVNKTWSDLNAQNTTTSPTYKVSDMFASKFPGVIIPDFLYLKSGETMTKTPTYTESGITTNKYIQLKILGGSSTSTYMTYTPSYIYQAMDVLEKDGYTITFFPFTANTMPTLASASKYATDSYFVPSFKACKTLESGEKILINVCAYSTTYVKATATSKKFNCGYYVTVNYLNNYENNTETAWGNSGNDTGSISELMTKNGLPALAFINLGVPSSEITATYYDSMQAVRLTAYNYPDATRLDTIKSTLESAGWSMEYRQYYSTSQTTYTAIASSTTANVYKYLSGTYTDADTGKKYVFELMPSYSEAASPTSATALVVAKTEVLYGKYVI